MTGFAFDDNKVQGVIKNLVPYVPASMFPGNATRLILGIDDPPQQTVDDVVTLLRQQFFSKVEEACSNACLLAKVGNEYVEAANRVRARNVFQSIYGLLIHKC